MKAYIFDSETTSKDPATALPIQASGIEVNIFNNTVTMGEQRTCYYLQDEEASPGALAIHGITKKFIGEMDALGQDRVIPGADFGLGQTCPDIRYMIGHNIGYDWEVAGKPSDVLQICTLKIIRWMHPDWEGHSLGEAYIRTAQSYFLDFDAAVEDVKHAHDAHYDVRLNFRVLQYIVGTLGIESIEDLWLKYNRTYKYPVVFPMGKHKGEKISDVVKTDRGYFAWLLRQADMDEDLKEACRRVL